MKKYFLLIRSKQWTKNFICFAGIIFSGNLFNLGLWFPTFMTFVSFCLISSSIYILNDILDKNLDANHPKKKNRPIANGQISISHAILISISFQIAGLFIGIYINTFVLLILIAYIVNNILYNVCLKKIPIADVLSIAFGFIFRLLAGIYCISLMPTPWIVLCTFFLALFLGFSKRRAELISIDEKNIIYQRPVLKYYNEKFLDLLISNTSFSAVISYALFCIISKKNPTLIITLPLVFIALMHYMNDLFNNKIGEEPESVLLNDKIIIFCILLWLILFVSISYTEVNIFSA